MSLEESSAVRCSLKKPTMSRIYPRVSHPQENKTLPSKASKNGKGKRVVEESSSEEEEDVEEEKSIVYEQAKVLQGRQEGQVNDKDQESLLQLW
jgi:hypothetical protein